MKLCFFNFHRSAAVRHDAVYRYSHQG